MKIVYQKMKKFLKKYIFSLIKKTQQIEYRRNILQYNKGHIWQTHT